MKQQDIKENSAGRGRLTTYAIGLHQDKVYRLLKYETKVALEKYNISTTEWVFLGLIFDTAKNQIRLSDAGAAIGVTASFITALMARLEKKGLVVKKDGSEDQRVKYATLTKKGLTFVPMVEKDLRKTLNHLAKGVSYERFKIYFQVIQAMGKNGTPPEEDLT